MHPQHGIILYGRRPDAHQHVSTTKSADELTAEAFRKPASGDCILAHLMRLSAILHLKGAGKDDDGVQSTFILSDYATRLKEENVLEVDLFLACEHFIETEEGGFFPTYAKLRKACMP